jgi:hypothetical protein
MMLDAGLGRLVGLTKIGLTPAVVLSQARVPVTVHDGKKNLVTTAQFFALWGKEVSDPIKVAQVVLRLAASDSLPAHLLIGSDAVRFAAEAEKTRGAEAAQWREVSLSTDVDSSAKLPQMRF